MTELILPRDSQRITIIGHTGYGKTVAAAWQLSLRSFDKMPWVIIDTKGDKLLNKLGAKEIALGIVPQQPGLFINHPLPHEEEATNDWLWKCYEKEKIGLFFDEGYYITGQPAFRAILTRGRSKNIPCITCTQRPVWLDRFVFSESDFFQVFWCIDARDRKTMQSFMPFDVNERLPDYHSTWYDVSRNTVIRLAPVPPEQQIIADFKSRLGKTRRAI